MEIFIMVNLKMINLKAKENIYGQIKISILDPGNKIKKMVMVNT